VIIVSTCDASFAASRDFAMSAAPRMGMSRFAITPPARCRERWLRRTGVAAARLGFDQHPADIAIGQRRIEFREHAHAQPVLGLRVDRPAQRGAGRAQPFVHVLGNLDDAHMAPIKRNVVVSYITLALRAEQYSGGLRIGSLAARDFVDTIFQLDGESVHHARSDYPSRA
jgi:hypothetical protein